MENVSVYNIKILFLREVFFCILGEGSFGSFYYQSQIRSSLPRRGYMWATYC